MTALETEWAMDEHFDQTSRVFREHGERGGIVHDDSFDAIYFDTAGVNPAIEIRLITKPFNTSHLFKKARTAGAR